MSGRPRNLVPKESVTVKLDTDVIEKLKEGGYGWSARMNEILRKALDLGERRTK